MARRLALACGLAALVALVVVLAREPERETTRAEEPPPRALATGGAHDTETTGAPEDRASAAPERVTAEHSAAPARAPDGGLSVRVVRAADGTPVAGGELLYLEEARADPVALRRYRSEVANGFEALARRFGGAARTDARGIARVPWPAWSVRVGCAHGELWGELDIFPTDDGEHELRLDEARALDVRVVDGEGRAVSGAPVVRRSRLGAAPYEGCERKLADRDGRVRFEHLRLAPEVDGVALAHFVALDLPVPAPVQERIDLERWPESPLTLVHPETGNIAIELTAPDGTPAAIDGTVQLTLAFDSRLALALAGHDESRASWTRDVERGRLVLEHVGLGLELAAYVWPHGFDAQPVDFRGPKTAGETVSVAIPLGKPAPVLAGRALDEALRPLANRTLVCEFWHGENANSSWWTDSVVTDEDGRFGGLGRGYLREPPAWFVLFRVHGTEPELARDLALPFPVPEGTIELGDVVLSAPPVIVSGSVLDPEGASLAGAHVSIERGRLEPKGRLETWSMLPGTRMTTDASGVFSIRARVPEGRLRLQVQRVGFFLPQPIPLLALPAEERVTLRRGATISGRVFVPSRRARDWVELRLRGGGEQRGTFAWLDDERFRWSGLPGGSYELALRLSGDPYGHVHVIGGIEARAGEEVHDPRLEPLELLRIAHAHRVTVETAGRPVTDARLALRQDADNWFEPPLAGEAGGRYTIHSFGDPLPSVRVRAPGCREAVVDNVSGEMRVLLEPGLRVRLVAAEPLPVPNGWQLAGILGGGDDQASGTYTPAGEVEFCVSKPGTYGLVLLLKCYVDGKEWAQRSLGTYDAFFDVVESPDEQVFTMPPLSDWIRSQLLAYDER